MSLMFPNNLLNEFLYQHNFVESDKCPNCEESAQTVKHVLFECCAVPDHYRELAYSTLCEYIGPDSMEAPGATAVLMGSRNQNFLQTCKLIVESQSLRTSIELS